MMPEIPPLLSEWLGALVRWVHVLAAIMWIGDSLLFMWMDSSLEPPRRPREGAVAGEMWMVHSGGFYEVVKRRSLAPEELPQNLYWFKWQAYTTWISGFFLLLVVYGLGDRALLVESGARLTHGVALAVAVGTLAMGWLVYDPRRYRSRVVRGCWRWCCRWRWRPPCSDAALRLARGVAADRCHARNGDGGERLARDRARPGEDAGADARGGSRGHRSRHARQGALHAQPLPHAAGAVPDA
jgi:hypothetical protein